MLLRLHIMSLASKSWTLLRVEWNHKSENNKTALAAERSHSRVSSVDEQGGESSSTMNETRNHHKSLAPSLMRTSSNIDVSRRSFVDKKLNIYMTIRSSSGVESNLLVLPCICEFSLWLQNSCWIIQEAIFLALSRRRRWNPYKSVRQAASDFLS